eukprot:CAMPEP_0202007802 /NCGR_PEP_ID=MMETSP0905-20130828/12182_1 /ASSEMBLY_ACC=CAM_ASM_000554 /TAXON_ID=420261 /ORGANISM="Thalassiosira antarctica, Strain CCMP982" /LENGTH=54 /DNA_ID=CAMNT_0048565817 /DNA_START=672 /DNA_END=833 /DNA_ORIENTATION=-
MTSRSDLTHTASGMCTRKKFDMFPEFVGGDDTAQTLFWSICVLFERESITSPAT